MKFKDLKPGRKFVFKDEADATSAIIVHLKLNGQFIQVPNVVSMLGQPKSVGSQTEVIEILDGFGLHDF